MATIPASSPASPRLDFFLEAALAAGCSVFVVLMPGLLAQHYPVEVTLLESLDDLEL